MKDVWKFSRVLFVLAAGLITTTCDNIVSLGSTIDTSLPVIKFITSYETGPGAILQDTETIYLNITDDSGVKSVMAVYTYNEPGEGGKPGEARTVEVPASWDEAKGIYTVDVITRDENGSYMADGPLTVTIIATDLVGKVTESQEVTYTIKNNPPSIDLNIPKLNLIGDSRPQSITHDPLGVTTGGFISGNASDTLAGVAPGYPKVKFWTETESLKDQGIPLGEPEDWNEVDLPAAWDSQGEKVLEFRYFLNQRDEDRKRKESEVLLPGVYYFKVLVKDILGHETQWPLKDPGYVPPDDEFVCREGYYYDDKVTITVQTAGTPPVIKITPLNSPYQNGEFILEASAEHPLGVMEMAWAVADPETPAKRIILAKTSDSPSGSPALSKKITKTFKAGETYSGTPASGGDPVLVTLSDGATLFYALATSMDSTAGEVEYQIYIDMVSPEVEVSRLVPFVEETPVSAHPEQYGTIYRVNGNIGIDITPPFDETSNGYTMDTPRKRQRKYILMAEEEKVEFDPATFSTHPEALGSGITAEALFNYSGARYFDDFPQGNVTINPDKPNHIDIATREFTDLSWLSLYVIDQDAAGNYNYTYAKIYVDQSTDIPGVEFADPKTGDIAKLRIDGDYASSILDSNGRMKISLRDDDKINAANTELRVWKYGMEPTPEQKLVLDIPGGGGQQVDYTISLQDLAQAFTEGTSPTLPDDIYQFTITTRDIKDGAQIGLEAASFTSPVFVFAKDTDYPRIGIDEGIRGAYQKTSFTLGGYAQDNAGIKTVTISLQPDGTDTSINPGSVSGKPGDRLNFTQPITGVDLDHRTLRITAEDQFGKTTVDDVEVLFDDRPPKVEITYPAGGTEVSSWVSGNIAAFNGTGTDWNKENGPFTDDDEGSNFKYVYYWIDKTGTVNPAASQQAEPDGANYFPALPGGEDDYTGWARVSPTKNDWQIYHHIREEQAGQMESTVGEDGVKAIYVIALDNAGNWSDAAITTIASRKFGVDQNSPELPTPVTGAGANKVGSSLYANDLFSFSFPAEDGNRLAAADKRVTIERAFNKGSAALITVPVTAGEGSAASTGSTKVWFAETTANKDYTYTLNEGAALVDGVYDYTITVEDAAGHQSQAAFTLTVDTTPPTVNITRYQSVITRSDLGEGEHSYVNDWIRINVTAADGGSGVGLDDKGTAEVTDDQPMAKWWFLPSAGPEPAWDTAGGTQFEATPLEALINTNTAAYNNTDRIFYVMVKDNAGNASHIASTDGNKNKVVRVNQASDKPVITVTAPLPDGFGDEGLVVQASLSDDDGFGAGALEYRFLKDAGTIAADWADDTTGWQPIGQQPSPAGGAAVPDITLGGQSQSLSMEKIFEDYGGTNWGNAAERNAALGPETVQKAVQIRAKDSPVNKVSPSGPSTAVVYQVSAPIIFTLDYTAPQAGTDFTAKADAADTGKSLKDSTWNGAPYISGAITERNLQSVTFTVGGISGPLSVDPSTIESWQGPPNGGSGNIEKTGDGEYTWYFNTAGSIWEDLAEGPHSAQIQVIDRIGRQTQAAVSFYKDTVAPVIAFSNIGSTQYVVSSELLDEVNDTGGSYNEWTGEAEGVDLSGKNDAEIHQAALAYYDSARTALAGSVIRSVDQNLRGVFSDDYSPIGGAGTVFEYRFDTDPIDLTALDDPQKTLWRPGTSGELTASGSKSTGWVIPIPAKDLPENTWQTDQAYPLKDGFRTVTLRVTDSLGNGHEDGAIDGPGIKTRIAFYLDREAPVITLGNSFQVGGAYPSNVVVNGGFTLEGEARDANLKQVTAIGFTGAAITSTDGGQTWTVPVTGPLFSGLSDGAYTVTLIAEDVAGTITTQNWTFIKDTAAPVNEFLNLDSAANTEAAPAYFANSGDKLMGNTRDDLSSLSYLAYTLEQKSGADWTSPAVIKTGEPLLTGGEVLVKLWNLVLGPGEDGSGLTLGDGIYRLKVTAKDSAKDTSGTPNESVNVPDKDYIYFVVDQHAPDLTVSVTSPYYNDSSAIKISGTAADTTGGSGIDRVALSIKGQEDTTQTQAAIEPGGAWTGEIDMAGAGLPGAPYTITITAYDKAGHAATQTKDFVYDVEEPEAEITSATAPDGLRVIGNTTIRGISGDNNSVSKIYYQIGKKETETAVAVTAIVIGNVYTIASVGTTTGWEALGAPAGAAAGTIFTAAAAGTGDGTVIPWKDTNLDNASNPGTTDTGYPSTVTWTRGLQLYDVNFAKIDDFVTGIGVTAADWGTQQWEYITNTDDIQPIGSGGGDAGRTNVWTLPVWILVKDVAGNFGLLEHQVRVDTHLDRAHVDILTPNAEAVVGGEIRLSGTANDNTYIESVYVRVSGNTHTDTEVYKDPANKGLGYEDWSTWSDWAQDNGSTGYTAAGPMPETASWWDWGKTTPETKANTEAPADSDPLTDDASGYGWHKAVLINNSSGVTNWYINLNSSGRLNPPGVLDTEKQRPVYIEVFARDSKLGDGVEDAGNGKNGYITRYVLVFSQDVPVVTNVKVERWDGLGTEAVNRLGESEYTPQMQISKRVVITAEVRDGDGLNRLNIKRQGEQSATDLLQSSLPGISLTYPPAVTGGGAITLGTKYLIAEGGGDFTSFGAANNDAGTQFTASSGGTYTGGGKLYTSGGDGNFVYGISMDLDTAALYPNGTGYYTLQVEGEDLSSERLKGFFDMSFQVDNYYPRGSFTAYGDASGIYDLRGDATDVPASGSVQGLKSVTVYFSRLENGNTVYYAPNRQGGITGSLEEDSTAPTPAFSFTTGTVTSYGNDRYSDDYFTTVKARKWNGAQFENNNQLFDVVYPKLAENTNAYFANNLIGYGIVIDHDETRYSAGDLGTAATLVDKDDFTEDWHDQGAEKIWGSNLNTRRFKDGKVTVHFVIEDLAGNRTYASSEINIKNNAPSLSRLTLGTALYGTVEAEELIGDTKYLESGFIGRNSLLTVKADLIPGSGNNRNYYRVSYAQRGAETGTVIKGGLYTIHTSTSSSVFTAVGAPNNQAGTSFIATASGNLGSGRAYPYSALGYTPLAEGDTLVSATDYIVDYPGDTDWTSVGAAAAHPAPGTAFTGNGGALSGTGTAYRADTKTVKTGAVVSDTLTAKFEAGAFTGPDAIPDSGTGTGSDRFFLIKVYDTTETMDTTAPFEYTGGAREENQLFDIILAGLRIENEDTEAPHTQLYDFNPAAETTRQAALRLYTRAAGRDTVTNPLQGGLYKEGSQLSGHIEPRDAAGLTGALGSDGRKPLTNNTSAWLETVTEGADSSALNTTLFKPAGFAQDTLSGRVIIRGYAEDNQRITALWLNIKGTPVKILDTIADLAGAHKVDASVTDADLDSWLGRLKPADTFTGPVDSSNPTVGVYDVLDLAGHRVEWAYVWNTEDETPVIGDVYIQVIGEDKSKASSDGVPGETGNSETTNNAAGTYTANGEGGGANVDYNRIGLDLAPYITTLTRYTDAAGSTKATELRSKNGWFSFRRSSTDTGGNERLQVEGFNLKGTNASTAAIDGTAVTGITSVSTAAQYFNVPAGAASGILAFSANNTAASADAIAAVNNRNNNANTWNREALAGNESSALWTDDRYVHLFDSYNTATGTNRGLFNKATGQANAKPIYPAMAINPANGTLFASFSSTVLDNNTAYMPVFYSSNGTTAATTIFRHSDPSEWTDISFNYNTSGTIPTVVYLGNVYLTDYSIGGLFAYDYNAATKTFGASNTATAAMSGVNSGTTYRYYNVERFADTNSGELYIWQNPRLVTSRGTTTGTQFMYTSYYDKRRGQLHYWGRATLTGTNAGGNNSRTWPQIIDGTTSTYTTSGNITNTAGGTKSAVAGEYSAIDLTSGGAPVIVYQAKDADGSETVKIAYPNTRVNTAPTGANWTAASIPGARGGRYISMGIDNNRTGATNDIHIAYMDGESGDLMYVHGSLPDAGNTCMYTFDAPLVIDSVGNVGKWTDLTLDDEGIPYISYLDQGGIDSRTGLKMAFYNPAISTAADQDPGTDVSGWEYLTLPGRYVVNDVRTQIEYDTRAARTWNAALAYVSGNDYRISYYLK